METFLKYKYLWMLIAVAVGFAIGYNWDSITGTKRIIGRVTLDSQRNKVCNCYDSKGHLLSSHATSGASGDCDKSCNGGL